MFRQSPLIVEALQVWYFIQRPFIKMLNSNGLNVSDREENDKLSPKLRLSLWEKAFFRIFEANNEPSLRTSRFSLSELFHAVLLAWESLQLLCVLLQFSLDIENYSEIHSLIHVLQLTRPDYLAVYHGVHHGFLVGAVAVCLTFDVVIILFCISHRTGKCEPPNWVKSAFRRCLKHYLQIGEIPTLALSLCLLLLPLGPSA